MPVIIAPMAKAYEQQIKDKKTPGPSKANKLAEKFATELDKGFKMAMCTIQVTGVLGNSPYSGGEAFPGKFQKAIAQGVIAKGYSELWSGNKLLSLAQYCDKEAKIIADAIAKYFKAGIWSMKVHKGPPLTATPMQADLLKSIIQPALMNAWRPDKIGLEGLKAQQLVTGINNAITAALPTITFAGAVASAPQGSATGVLI